MSEKIYGRDAPFPFAKAPDGLYPEEIPFRSLYEGNSGPNNAVHAILHSRAQLDAVCGPESLPGAGDVDFDKEQIIIVSAGPKRTSGHKVAINAVMYFTDRGNNQQPLITVTYSEFEQAPPTQDVITHPVMAVSTRRLTGAVDFVRQS